ncbi:MAG: hybrid sensor histidine kinase/response regulator, partial [Flavobacterium sp.]|nr:hybrid sensor histidine kinase/response regulator [Flavobacterium sp.]
MKKHLLVFFIPFFLFAQKNSKQVDLLVLQSDSCFKEMNYKCALEKVEKAEKIVPNNINQRHLLATKKAACYTKLRQFDLAIQTLEQIKLSNPQDKAALENYLRALNIRANIHYSNYEDEFAIKKYLQIDSICSTYNHISETQIKALQNIGLMFLRGYEDGKKAKHLRARDFFTAAYEKADKANFMVEKHMAGLNLGSTFLSDSIPSVSKALTFYKEAEVYFEKNQLIDDLNQVYWAYASLYTQNKAYDKAAFYHQKKIKNMLKSGNQHAIGTSYWSFAGFFMDRQLYRDAIENYQKAIESLNKVKDKDYGILASCYYYCAEAHAKLNEDKKAYHYLIDYLVYKDSVDIKQNQIAFNDLETKYQTQKKEQEIALLTAQNQIAEKQKYIYIALAGLLLLAGLSLFFGYRNKIKTAQKLNELNELKSRFFANISHEFRTPLTLIKSPVQQLQNTLSDENQKKQLRLIDNNANRMLELVDQLLELSKIDSGQLKIILKKGNLHHFFQAILEPFSFKAKEDHQRLTFSTENLDFETYFDRDIVTKITSNLVDNALKYNEAGKPIEFIATQQNQHLLLKVSNYNNQLSETDYQKLFDRFYQKNNAVSGFGIGLALVKDLVELYEGTITTDFNQGKISFTVELPLQKELTHALVIAEDAEIKKETLTEISSAAELPLLLVVDDNASIREVYQDLFKDHFQILEASTGKEALLLAQKEIPDCIISDVMMPEM